MDLQILWFILISVLFVGFFILEGFDYGVGILLPFVAKNDTERRVTINTIGPHWDGNEVWLLTAGGAIFAAFPNWYATLFSGFYLALFLILIAMIVRGIAFEFRSKLDDKRWRLWWDRGIVFGSAIPALLWGVAVANIARGVAIDSSMTYIGSFFDLLNPYALAGGLTTLLLFTLHGALFLSLKTDGVIQTRATSIAKRLVIPVAILVVAVVLISAPQLLSRLTIFTVLALVIAVAGLGLTLYHTLKTKRNGLAFAGTSAALAGAVLLFFAYLFPRVMPSSLGEAFDLTIYNASSSQYTLSVMSVIGLTVVPIVLAYQAWTYWVFRKRLTDKSHLEY
jgi:cytochrome d ubiquinol oxidase subunit II